MMGGGGEKTQPVAVEVEEVVVDELDDEDVSLVDVVVVETMLEDSVADEEEEDVSLVDVVVREVVE
jgi:hypothetical protein